MRTVGRCRSLLTICAVIASTAPRSATLRLVGDERFRRLGLFASTREGLGNDRLQVVDVIQVAALQLSDLRIEIARHCEVDQEQRPTAPIALRPLDLVAAKD